MRVKPLVYSYAPFSLYSLQSLLDFLRPKMDRQLFLIYLPQNPSGDQKIQV